MYVYIYIYIYVYIYIYIYNMIIITTAGRPHYPKYDDNVCCKVFLAIVVEKPSHMHGSGHHVSHIFRGASLN